MKLAYCGIDCGECEAFLATQENDDTKRTKVAGKWSKMFGEKILPNEINCNGCHSDLLFGHCKACEIRKCGSEKKIDTCADCSEYGCEKLKVIHDQDQTAKSRLDNIVNR